MTARELTWWAAFERVDGPLSVEERIDIGFAKIAYILARVNYAGRGRGPQITDFLPPYIRDEFDDVSQQTPEQLRAVMESMIHANH